MLRVILSCCSIIQEHTGLLREALIPYFSRLLGELYGAGPSVRKEMPRVPGLGVQDEPNLFKQAEEGG